jgi:hypothetical protein
LMLTFYAAVAWLWVWHSLLHLTLRRDTDVAGALR